MNIRHGIGIALMSATCALVIGCDQPAAPGREKEIIQPGYAATANPSCVEPATSIGPQQKVTAGTYCVCDTGSHEAHDGLKGWHLQPKDTVVLGTLAAETTVQLGATPLKMKRSADEKELTALVEYEHEKDGHPHKLVHKVQVTRFEGRGTMCDPINKNVLRIRFCGKKGSDWDCSEPGGHLGDTHVQN
jgi:hypothetical protein